MTDLYPMMVATEAWSPWHYKGEAALKRNMEHHGSPLKLKRLREQAPCLIPPPTFDFRVAQSNHQAECNSKCAGTQTSFSAFANTAGFYVPPPQSQDIVGVVPPHPASEERFILDLDQYSQSPHIPSFAPSLAHQRPPRPSSFPSLHQLSLHKDADTTNNLPLNLTVASSQLRPSVITRASSFNSSGTPPMYHKSARRSASLRTREHLRNGWRQEITQNDGCDPIEEHFRRSLGKNYPGYMTPPTTPSHPTGAVPSPTGYSPPLPTMATLPKARTPPTAVALPIVVAPPTAVTPPTTAAISPTAKTTTAPALCVVSMTDSTAVSVAGSVDDHFAKSLGATWSRLKQKNEMNDHPGTVDDHFAKALGDTWFKLQASQNTSGATTLHNSASSSPSPSLPIHNSAMRT